MQIFYTLQVVKDRSKYVKLIWIMVLILMSVFKVHAQEPRHYTVNDGLPSNHVYTATQDKDGFMWFGTNRGIAKFDGESFKIFTVKEGLPNNDIWLIQSDYTGKVWYGSKSMYQGYILNDSVYKFVNEDSVVITPKFIHYDDTMFWFGSYKVKGNKLVSDYNRKSVHGKIKKLVDNNNWETNYIANYPIGNKIIVLSKLNVLVYDTNLVLINKFKRSIINTKFNEKRIVNFGMFSDGKFYFSFENGVMLLNFKSGKVSDLFFSELKIDVNYNEVICREFNREIQISLPNHLILYDSNLNFFSRINLPNIKGISFKDKLNNIWIYNSQGLFQVNYRIGIGNSSYLSNKKVQKIGKFSSNFIIGVKDEPYYFIDKEYQVKPERIPSSRDVYQISNNKLLVSSNGIYKYNGKRFISIEKYSDLNNLGGMKSYKYYFENDSIAIVLISARVYLCNLKTNSIIKVYNENGWANVVKYKNKVFLGGTNGLYFFKNEKITELRANTKAIKSSIVFLNKNSHSLFIGTDGRGLYIYKDSTIFHLKATDGLVVQKVVEENGFLWLSTQDGVKKVLINNDNIESSMVVDSYYDSDGLAQNNTNDIYLEDSFLFVASDNGLDKLNLNNPNYLLSPKLYYKSKTDYFELSYSAAKSLAISFGAIDFVNQKYLKYSYRMLPSQKEWVETKVKTLNFSNLKPGEYQLAVRVINQHQKVDVKYLFILIHPEWWQTIAFRVVILAFCIVLITFFTFYYMNKNKNIVRTNLEREKRISGLELQALRSQMNPHFVHNSLNSIQFFIQKNSIVESENYISKFSNLVRRFFEYSRKQNVTLSQEIELVQEYLEIEKIRFEDKLEFSIVLDIELNKGNFIIPSMILQPIIENAVNHGVFHKDTKGTVLVEFKYIDIITFGVVIEDDGIGINNAKLLKMESDVDYDPESHSTSVLVERLDLLKHSRSWDITYNILDLSSTSHRKNGTRVELVFKHLKKYE